MSEINKSSFKENTAQESFNPDKRIEKNTGYTLHENYDPNKRIKIPDNYENTIDFNENEVYNNYENNKVSYEEIRSINDESTIEQSLSKEYYDDNGIKYREGDRLLPNAKFEVNGYKYETDDKGRIISAEGTLQTKKAGYNRDMENVRTMDGQSYKSTDDRGHLIGHQFNGSDKLENLVPMDAKLNQGDYKKLEATLADAVKEGETVTLKVEPIYTNDSTRPSEFRVTYSIDGEKETIVFQNESEAKT